MSDERFPDDLTDDTIVGDSERREAMRLADVLDALDAGAPAPMSAVEDPELASLVQTATLFRDSMAATTETASYQSYRARSRAYILHTMEEQQRAAQQSQRSAGLVPFVRRRWAVLAPVAAAAAVASFTFFSSNAGAPTGEGSGPAIASNLTVASTDAELDRIRQAIELLSARAERGEPVDATLLRTITETSAAVANRIDVSPRLVSRDHVATYQKTLTAGTAVLTAVQPAAGSEDALAAAQRATQDGVVAAARYLGAEATATASTATPSSTATATPRPTQTGTVAPTATVPPTATAAPTSTAGPTASPTASSTPAPTEGSVRP